VAKGKRRGYLVIKINSINKDLRLEVIDTSCIRSTPARTLFRYLLDLKSFTGVLYYPSSNMHGCGPH
jgi:hypothetical protein